MTLSKADSDSNYNSDSYFYNYGVDAHPSWFPIFSPSKYLKACSVVHNLLLDMYLPSLGNICILLYFQDGLLVILDKYWKNYLVFVILQNDFSVLLLYTRLEVMLREFLGS